MAQTNLCRLCVNPCVGPKSLYDANGVGNWVYQVTAKFFQSVFSNAAENRSSQFPNICSKCWCSIVDYHNFEQSIFDTQAKLLRPAPDNVCRLCVCSYGGDQYKRLCSNPDNEVYQIILKYMHSMLSNPNGQHLTDICFKCWDHLQKFHKYQTDIFEAQKMLPKDEKIPHGVIVKVEDEIVRPIVNQICVSQTTKECASTSVKYNAIDAEYETIYESKHLANEISCNERLDPPKLFGHDEQVDNITFRKSSEDVPTGFKDASYYQDSITLPKSEIMETDSNQVQLEFPVLGNVVQIKSEPIVFLVNEIMDESKPLANDLTYSQTLDQQKILNHDKQMANLNFRKSSENIHSGFKDHQDSITLPKLEVMDVHPEDVSNQVQLEFPVLDNAVQIKSEPIVLVENDTMDEPTLLANGITYSQTFNQQNLLGFDKQVPDNSEACSKTLQRSFEGDKDTYKCEICHKCFRSNSHLKRHTRNVHKKSTQVEVPANLKDANCYQDSISLPKLEIMDVPSEADFNQENPSDESSGEAKGTDCQPSSSKGNDQSPLKKKFGKETLYMKRFAPKGFDNLVAQWKPNLECVICHGLFTSLTFLLKHFHRQHSKSEFYILCCQRKLVNCNSIAEHANIHLNSVASTSNISGKHFNSNHNKNSYTEFNELLGTSDSTDLSEYETMNESKLFEHEISQSKHHGHDEQVRGRSEAYNRSDKGDKATDSQLKTNTCNICFKAFKNRNSYTAHRIRKHLNYDKNEEKFKEFDEILAKFRGALECELCGESVAVFTELEQHFRIEHPHVKCFFTCCNRKLQYRSQITEHIAVLKHPNTYKCEICHKCLRSKNNLKRHIKTLHNKSAQNEAGVKANTLNDTSNNKMHNANSSIYNADTISSD